ncbi:DUF551 domain-containing protein [Dysgonomonas sp. 520]|uniref:DUF551 domain-containing protein n=1 Tax=Dysgonomonas sp. 520 TaxID=2302931 RepID=UPI0013D11876|nr:DUF551 domain-containing protein [Dysgonomonas sp. 520]NDW09398.1 DUF551 domain-containing protein [Dysgonomonas sp. 520]
MNPKDLEQYQQYYYTNSIWQITVTYLYETINGYVFEFNGTKKQLSYSEVTQYLEESNLSRYSPKEFKLYYEGISKGIQLGFELVQKWIPINESLPKINDKVLVISKNQNVYLCYLDSNGKFHNANSDNLMKVDITHWMYLELP